MKIYSNFRPGCEPLLFENENQLCTRQRDDDDDDDEERVAAAPPPTHITVCNVLIIVLIPQAKLVLISM